MYEPGSDPEAQAADAVQVIGKALQANGYSFEEGKPGVFRVESPNGMLGYAVIWMHPRVMEP